MNNSSIQAELIHAAEPSKMDLPEPISTRGRIKVRLTLGPALIDFEATLEETVVVVVRTTQEFTRAGIITAPET